MGRLGNAGFGGVLAMLVLGGCVRNTTTDPSLSAKDSPTRRLCDGLVSGRYEMIFKLMPTAIQRKANLRTLHLDLDLPKAQYVASCRLWGVEETASRKGQTTRAVATYVIKQQDGGVGRYKMYFKKERGRWWLLPSYDIR